MSLVLSKSKFCQGVQCPKMLWMQQYKPEEAEDTGKEAVLRIGNEVGDLAMQYFGEFTEVPYGSREKMAEATQKLMAEGKKIIAEASFLHDTLFCSVDLLKFHEDGTADIIEVKSATSIKDIYYFDMAFQYHVVSQCGLKIAHVYNLYLNKEYIRQGALDLQALFVMQDCTEEILSMQEKIPAMIKIMMEYNDTTEEPDMKIGEHCREPYACAFHSYCHRDVPQPSVLSISGMNNKKKYGYYHAGVVTFQDIIHKKVKLTENQMMQVQAVVKQQPPIILKDEIKAFTDSLTYPLYYLDFETYQQAIPQFDGVSPYMQIPFQYSLHIQSAPDAPLEHKAFLGNPDEDPRRALAEQLCREIPMNVCTLAYNMSFEKGVLKRLAAQFPDLSDHLLNIAENMKDLMTPFQKRHYYCREMMGAYSIKTVLPLLCSDDPELDYQTLEGIHNGSEAMNAFADLSKRKPEEIAEIRKQLLAYCRLDTLAMVKILEKLRDI